jgi:predicted AAA+ superfamily ATPase
MSERRILTKVLEDLPRKMVLLSGPRQCGKTTLARAALVRYPGSYYNWDIEADRKALRAGRLNEDASLWVFDEIHKFRSWRNWLKGQFDLHHQRHSILVTGSARLEVYSRGGDSLQGRYFAHRLHPFTLSELLGLEFGGSWSEIPELPAQVPVASQSALGDLLALGGFPEPLFSASQRFANRWRLGYATRLVREEIRDLENIRDLDRMEMIFVRLTKTVGSVLSLNSLREDLEVAFGTVKLWVEVFERIYGVFRIAPFGAPRIKAVKKENKLYLWDWPRVESDGARLENLVALHLLRLQHWVEDVEGERLELRYFRDTVGHEVDFIVLRKGKPWMAIEVKKSEQGLDPNLKYFLERVKVPYAFQIHQEGAGDYRAPDIQGCRIRVMPAAKFLANLP